MSWLMLTCQDLCSHRLPTAVILENKSRQLLPSSCVLLTQWVTVMLADSRCNEKQGRKDPRCSFLTGDPVQKLCCLKGSKFGAKCDQWAELKLDCLQMSLWSWDCVLGPSGKVLWGFFSLKFEKESCLKRRWLLNHTLLWSAGSWKWLIWIISGPWVLLGQNLRHCFRIYISLFSFEWQVQGQSQNYKPMDIITLSF